MRTRTFLPRPEYPRPWIRSHATVKGGLLAQVVSKMKNGHIRLRCLVPKEDQPHGGLTIYRSASVAIRFR
jgi:hypothetical protein